MTKVTKHIMRMTVVVPEIERAIVRKDGVFQSMLGTGRHNIRTGLHADRYTVEPVSLVKGAIMDERLDSLYANHTEALDEHLMLIETGLDEMAVVYRNGTAAFVFAPESRRLVFRDAGEFSVETISIADSFAIPEGLSRRLMRVSSDFIKRFKVEHGQVGLLYVDGKLSGELASGGHAFFGYGRVITVKIVDIREHALDVSGQEILTRDRVSIRVNVSATYRVTDPVKAVSVVRDYADTLYRSLATAFRRSLTDKTLDEVLAKKGKIDADVTAEVVAELALAGVEVLSATVKDIILPGDMRDILNTVVVAEKEAEANVIRRREVTAETRTLLNTAKVMADNPAMMRLKELEALESISEKVGSLTIHSGTKGLMEDIVSLKTR